MKYPKTIDVSLERLDETTSTNDYLAKLCKEGKAKEFHIVTTEHQTAGKGQRGNSWESEDGKNLLFSLVLYPTAMEVKDQFYLSMLTAIAITESLKNYTNDFHIKWPNDIYWKDKKIAGILIENELEGKYINQCIIGVGLNVNQEFFVSNAPNPVSLKQIIGKDIDRYDLLKKIIHGIVACYCQLEKDFDQITDTIRHIYINNIYRRKGFHAYRDAKGPFKAEFYQIEPTGHLLLKDEAGTIRRYTFKEVEYILHESE